MATRGERCCFHKMMVMMAVACSVRQVVMQVSTTTQHVTLSKGGPYIMTQPGNQTVLEGQRVIFPCGTEGYPSIIDHVWFKDNVAINVPADKRHARITILDDGSLVITTTIKSDKGWYRCRASNGLGHDEASAYLNVVYKPVVNDLAMKKQVDWAKGYRQQLDCPVDSNPPLIQVVWVKDQSLIQSKGRYDVLSNGTLLVTEVTDADAGSYSCTPENAMGRGLSSNRVQVAVKESPDFLVEPLKQYIRNVGDSVVMNCTLKTGKPAASLQWIKVGGKLDGSTDRITITDKYLEIKNLTKDDHGNYECRGINNLATIVRVAELRIDNTTPHAPFNVTVVPGIFNVTISWEPAYDGGTPQFYILWFREVSQFDWSTMAVPSQAVTSFNLYALQPDTEYEFKILSRNEKGNGSFSDVVRQRTLGYSPDAVNALPLDKDGVPYHPEITIKHGPEPATPVDLTARVKDRNIYLSWRTPLSSPVPIFSYKIEYQHGGGWQYYGNRIVGNTTNSATMYDMPAGTYDIYLRSYGVLSYSPWSNVARVHVPGDDVVIPQAMVGGIIGGVLFLLVAILLALVAVFYSRRKERKAKEKKYDDVNYGKPDEMNGRHHPSAAKRDRWQHNGRGDVMTSLNDTDGIFFLPQIHSLDQAASVMRPSILLDTNDRNHLYGRGVADGKGYDTDFGRLVPLTNEQNFMSDRSDLESARPGSHQLDVRNLTWPHQHHERRFEQPPFSTSQQPSLGHVPESYIPSHDDTHPQGYLQHSYSPQIQPSSVLSHSDPSPHMNQEGHFSPVVNQHPSHSKHMPSSSSSLAYPSAHACPPSFPQDTHSDLAATDSHRQEQGPLNSHQYPYFHSEDDDDVFGDITQSSDPQHHQVPGFPRHSSMKPGQETYLNYSRSQQSQQLSALEDISSVAGPSEQPSLAHPSHFWHILQPSTRPVFENSANIPGYYVSTGDQTKPHAMVVPHQVHHVHRDTQQLPQVFTDHSPAPPRKFTHKSSIPEFSDRSPQSHTHLHGHPIHSKLARPVSHTAADGSSQHEDTWQQRPAQYTISEFFNEPYHYNEPLRPRASSEGRLRMKQPLYPHHYGPDHPIPGVGRPAYSSASNPDMSLPRHERTVMEVRDPHQAYPDTDYHPYHNVHTFVDHGENLPSDLYHPYQQTSPPVRDKPAPPFLDRSAESDTAAFHPFVSRQEHHELFTAPRPRYLGSLGDQTHRNSPGEVIPGDSVSHSSGIGSRNTSHSASSYHAHGQAGGKSTASFSSGHGHDMSLDISSGHGAGMPKHITDVSGDENYEFDSLNALEDDIMDDLRRYSQLSGGYSNPESPHSHASQYPDSQRRFEQLREEFKQYRQHQYYPSDGLFQMPPTALSALPLGVDGQPLYPMDSEML